MRKIFLASTILAAMAGSALAADDIAAPAATDWSGAYFGGHGGYAHTDLTWGLQYPYGNPPASSSLDSGGAFWGVQLGYQRQYQQWVFGGEISYADGFSPDTISGLDLWSPGVGTLNADMGGLFLAVARAGRVNGDWLTYVKGGYANAEITLSADDNVPPDFGFVTTDHYHGWVIGAGIEKKFAHNATFGIEYDHLNLSGNASSPVVVLSDGSPVGGTGISDIDVRAHRIMFRLNFALGN